MPVSLIGRRIEQTMEMGYEIAHMGIVHRFQRLSFPGLLRRFVVGENSDDIELGQIAKLSAAQIRKFATKYKMEKLFAFRAHELPLQSSWRPTGHCFT